MIDWLARARHEILNVPQDTTDETDETPLSSVSSVPIEGLRDVMSPVSSASSVGMKPLRDHATLIEDLLDAATRVCDSHGDGEAGRAQMRADCLALDQALQADLLQHFLGQRALTRL